MEEGQFNKMSVDTLLTFLPLDKNMFFIINVLMSQLWVISYKL